MRRRLVHLGLVVATLLSIAIAVVWVRSYSAFERFRVEQIAAADRAGHYLYAEIWAGRLHVRGGLRWIQGTSPAPPSHPWADSEWSLTHFSMGGFPYVNDPTPSFVRFRAHLSPPEFPYVGDLNYVPLFLVSNRSTLDLDLHLYWLFAAAILFPLVWIIRLIWSDRRFPVGHCHQCGYDLRASPERCPECGAVAAGAGSRQDRLEGHGRRHGTGVKKADKETRRQGDTETRRTSISCHPERSEGSQRFPSQ